MEAAVVNGRAEVVNFFDPRASIHLISFWDLELLFVRLVLQCAITSRQLTTL